MPRPRSPDDPFRNGLFIELVRPAAVVPEEAAQAILADLARYSVLAGGTWLVEASRWHRYDRPWPPAGGPGPAGLIGSLQIAYGTPTKYEITIYQVAITRLGGQLGWTATALADEALGFGGLTLADCPQSPVPAPPRPIRF